MPRNDREDAWGRIRQTLMAAGLHEDEADGLARGLGSRGGIDAPTLLHIDYVMNRVREQAETSAMRQVDEAREKAEETINRMFSVCGEYLDGLPDRPQLAILQRQTG